jgi:hypothetical protein
MSRVVATFNANRYSVRSKSSDGNVENSRGCFTVSVININRIVALKLTANNKSRTIVGSGTMNTTSNPNNANERIISLRCSTELGAG